MELQLDSFPFSDIDTSWAAQSALMAQNVSLFSELHAGAESLNIYFRLTHVAIARGMEFSIENTDFQAAATIGLQAYEIVGGFASTDITHTVQGEMFTIENARRLLEQVRLGNLLELGSQQYSLFESRVPQLFAAVQEISERHLHHNDYEITYAISAAAIMHGMHRKTARMTAEAIHKIQ